MRRHILPSLRLSALLSALSLFFLPCFLSATPGYFEPWGKDSDLYRPPSSLSTPPPSHNFLSQAAEKVILFRQNVLSPADGPRSHFRPTSSRYMLLAIRRYGFLKGYLMGCDRLLRENSEDWVYEKRVFDRKKYKWNPAILPFPH